MVLVSQATVLVIQATLQVTQATPTIRQTMGTAIRVTPTPMRTMATATIQAMDTATTVPLTALIGAIIDALHVEFIGDGTAGIRRG
jgi:hypothetical protein